MKAKMLYLTLLLSGLAACKSESEGAKSGNEQKTMNVNTMGITQEKALEIAKADAIVAYHDLSPYKVEIQAEGDNWKVDYELKDENSLGGGPHYVIDGKSGEIVSRRYEQ